MSENIGEIKGAKHMSELRDDLIPASISISTFCGPADIESSSRLMVQLTMDRYPFTCMHLTREQAFELAHLLLKAYQ